MMMGLYDVEVLMGISAAGLKEQSRCMCVCVPLMCACTREGERERELSGPLFAIPPLRNSNCDPCSVKNLQPAGTSMKTSHTRIHKHRTNEDIPHMYKRCHFTCPCTFSVQLLHIWITPSSVGAVQCRD